MNGYVFVANSTKPSLEKANSREPIVPSNVSRPCLEAALDLGYSVCLGVNRNKPEELDCDLPIKLYDSHTYRSITAFKDNLIAFKNLSKVIKDNNVKVIHCNTPVGGMIGRLCGFLFHVDKVIYTAHGFHFYKGAPRLNNLVFKTAEAIMAHWTDVLITMNNEDYLAAQKFHLRKGGKVYKVHGVGIDTNQFTTNPELDIDRKKAELGLNDNDIICISAGDLIARKNYEAAINALGILNNPQIHYLICGEGPKKEDLIALAKKYNIENNVHFLGYRSDIKDLLQISDIFLLTSFQEGLPRSLMEAMAYGLPVVASNIRGNVDLISNKVGGYLIHPQDSRGISKAIDLLVSDNQLRFQMGANNKEIIEQFDITQVKNEIKMIYNNELRSV